MVRQTNNLKIYLTNKDWQRAIPRFVIWHHVEKNYFPGLLYALYYKTDKDIPLIWMSLALSSLTR